MSYFINLTDIKQITLLIMPCEIFTIWSDLTVKIWGKQKLLNPIHVQPVFYSKYKL